MRSHSTRLLQWGSAFLLVFLLITCGGEKKTTIYTLSDLVFTFDGPIYSGPNSGQITHKVNLSQYLPDKAKLREVKLNSVSVSSANGESLSDDIQSFSLQIASSGSPMKQVAVKNPTDSGATSTLSTAEANLLDYFKSSGDIFLILDADFKDDKDDDVILKGAIQFTLTYTL